ncbi:MAG: P1 family peptidase [Armatimonadetes bacterium]|nr:P1 family peptidase [Armatimonadota bacterium]
MATPSHDWGSLSQISGIRVGHMTDAEALTGCTVVLTEGGSVAAACVMGGAPATLGTDALRPLQNNEELHAVLLAGGSAFGLAAAAGVMRFLEERDVGVRTRGGRVPIVAGAAIYDLAVGHGRVRSTETWGYEAAVAATDGPFGRGNVGAGTGATTGKWRGGVPLRGGLGTAALCLAGGITVAALVVVNAIGDAVNPATGRFYATDGGFHHSALPTIEDWSAGCGFVRPWEARDGGAFNTTIGVVATNARLTKAQVARVAQMAHLGLARSLRPVHTSGDGDTLFALSVGGKQRRDLGAAIHGVYADVIGSAAADVVALAVLDAMLMAESIPGYPSVREHWGLTAEVVLPQ